MEKDHIQRFSLDLLGEENISLFFKGYDWEITGTGTNNKASFTEKQISTGLHTSQKSPPP